MGPAVPFFISRVLWNIITFRTLEIVVLLYSQKKKLKTCNVYNPVIRIINSFKGRRCDCSLNCCIQWDPLRCLLRWGFLWKASRNGEVLNTLSLWAGLLAFQAKLSQALEHLLPSLHFWVVLLSSSIFKQGKGNGIIWALGSGGSCRESVLYVRSKCRVVGVLHVLFWKFCAELLSGNGWH